MIIKEFRVVLPMTVDEYQVAQLYSVAEASKNETGGGEGIEVVTNEPFSSDPNEKLQGEQPKTPLLNGSFTSGQYTYKIYHLASKLPQYIRILAPRGSTEIVQKSWNSYPNVVTTCTNQEYMKDNFTTTLKSIHLPDRGDTHNALDLTEDELSQRVIEVIDIVNDPVSTEDYKPDEDPKLYKSERTGRGPLSANWKEEVQDVMCCYKVVTIMFKWFGLQDRVERLISMTARREFLNFHRGLFCWTDQWYGLTMTDIRKIEVETKVLLDEMRREGSVKGLVVK